MAKKLTHLFFCCISESLFSFIFSYKHDFCILFNYFLYLSNFYYPCLLAIYIFLIFHFIFYLLLFVSFGLLYFLFFILFIHLFDFFLSSMSLCPQCNKYIFLHNVSTCQRSRPPTSLTLRTD